MAGYANENIGDEHYPTKYEVARLGGFRLRHQRELAEKLSEPDLEWSVELPHQCDEWEIGHGATVSDVATHLQSFIADATAMSKLIERIAQGE